jgi:hypothetical protein
MVVPDSGLLSNSFHGQHVLDETLLFLVLSLFHRTKNLSCLLQKRVEVVALHIVLFRVGVNVLRSH